MPADRFGRDFITGEDSLAVEAYRDRLFAQLGFEDGKGRKALDLGCGDGLEAIYLLRRGWKVEGLDIQPHPRWSEIEAKWKGRAKFRTGDAAALKAAKGGYDLVFEKDMLHHVPQPLDVLAEMKRLVKAGGRVVIAECNRLNPVFYIHLTLLGGHQHFTRRRLRALLEKAGLANYSLRLREARVWPLECALFQRLMDRVQDLIERMRIFNPWLCYHLVSWEKPRG
jgi:2-polyprenyl-3-methyl-5-hydroxy-6-metoxy-1,4-benzoquinol methylase